MNHNPETKSDSAARLHQRELFAVAGRLAVGAASELNNPSGFIASNLGILREYIETLGRVVNFAEQLAEAVVDEKSDVAGIMAAELQWYLTEYDVSAIRSDAGPLIADSIGGIERISDIARSMSRLSPEFHSMKPRLDLADAVRQAMVLTRSELRHVFRLALDLDDTTTIRTKNSCIVPTIVNILLDIRRALPEGGTIAIRSETSDSDARLRFLYGGPAIRDVEHSDARALIEQAGGSLRAGLQEDETRVVELRCSTTDGE